VKTKESTARETTEVTVYITANAELPVALAEQLADRTLWPGELFDVAFFSDELPDLNYWDVVTDADVEVIFE
jgi:hypothetical protein